MTELGLKPKLSGSKNCDGLPLHYIGCLWNNWHCHSWFPSIKNELECYHINVLQVHWSATPHSYAQSESTKPLLANHKTQLLRIPVSAGKAPGRGTPAEISPTGTFLPLSDLQTCSEIDRDPWNRATMLLGLKINDSNISILFRSSEVKYSLSDKIIKYNRTPDIWWH